MSESTKYENLKNNYTSTVYVIQHIPGTQAGNPKKIEKADFKKLAKLKGKKNGVSKKSKIA